jgi:hypothetical protein
MRLLLLIFLGLIPLTGNGQQRVSGFSIFGNWGLQHINTQPINDVLDANNYAGEFNRTFFSSGVGTHAFFNNVVIGTTGRARAIDRRRSAENIATFTSFSGNMFAGYVVLSGERFILFPSIGFGAVQSTLNVRPRLVQATFQEIVQDPESYANQNARLVHLSPYFRPALHLDFFPFSEHQDGLIRGFMVGLSAGYTFSGQGRWRLNGSRILQGPDFNPSGFIVSLRAGWGLMYRR